MPPSISRRAVIGLAGALLAPAWRTRARLNRSDGRRWRMAAGIFSTTSSPIKPLAGNQLAVFTEREGARRRGHAGDDARDEILGMHLRPPPKRRARTSGCASSARPRNAVCRTSRDRVDVRAGRRRCDRGGNEEFTFGLGIGPTLVELEWKQNALAVCLDDATEAGLRPHPAGCRQGGGGLGLPADALRPGVPPQEVNCGSAFFMVPLVSRAAVDQAAFDARAIAAVFEAAKITRRGLFIFSTEPGADGATAYSRMMGANEDSATGSASGPLGCYLVKHGLVPGPRREHRQRARREDGPPQPHPHQDRRHVADRHHPRASRRHQRPRRRGLATGFVRLGAWGLGRGLAAWAWGWRREPIQTSRSQLRTPR